MQMDQRRARVDEFVKYFEEQKNDVQDELVEAARQMRLDISRDVTREPGHNIRLWVRF